MPAVAVAPLLTIWIGYGLVPIVVLCVMATTIHWCLHELERRSRVVDSLRGRRAT